MFINNKKLIFIASDHAGYSLKKTIIQELIPNITMIDLGTDSADKSVDYNDFANALVYKIKSHQNAFGILICKTGNGMCMAANRHLQIRAALCTDIKTTQLARQHNDANVLVMPSTLRNAKIILNMFINTKFSYEDRHIKRIQKLG